MKTALWIYHFMPLNFDLRMPDTDSPDSLLYGLLGLLLFGVLHAVYAVTQVEKGTKPECYFTISEAQLN